MKARMHLKGGLVLGIALRLHHARLRMGLKKGANESIRMSFLL